MVGVHRGNERCEERHEGSAQEEVHAETQSHTQKAQAATRNCSGPAHHEAHSYSRSPTAQDRI
jgi:hypothetical protein